MSKGFQKKSFISPVTTERKTEVNLPQLDTAEQNRIQAHLRKVVAGKSHMQLIIFTTILAYENARLVQEVNRLRALAGEEPMKTYNPGE